MCRWERSIPSTYFENQFILPSYASFLTQQPSRQPGSEETTLTCMSYNSLQEFVPDLSLVR